MNPAHEILTKENEKQLLLKLKNGCSFSKEELIRKNYRLVLSVANRYACSRHLMDDLVQEGLIGLMIAINKFDPESNNRFSTYAMYWVKQRIMRFMEGDSVIRVPSWVHVQRSKLRPFSECSDEEAAKMLDLPEKTVKSVRNTVFAISMDDMMYGDKNENHIFIPSNDPTSEDILIQEEDRKLTFELMEGLKPVEKEIILRRYGIGREKETFDVIGKYFGVSRERIRQMQVKAQEKMRKSAEIKGLSWEARD